MATAGRVDFPAYMKDWHEHWLGNYASSYDTVSETMGSALANNPFDGKAAYDPSSELSDMISAVSDFYNEINSMDHIADWKAIVDESGYNSTGIDTYDAQMTDQLESKTLPKYRAGMRNIGAVMTSAFTIGESVIYGFKNRDVNQHASQLALQGVQQMSEKYANKLNGLKAWMSANVEALRIKIVAMKEETDSDIRISEDQAKWPLEVYQYGANLLASISGAPSISSGTKSPSTGQSALAGALSGAALGGAIAQSTDSISSGWGALGGAAAGAALSFL